MKRKHSITIIAVMLAAMAGIMAPSAMSAGAAVRFPAGSRSAQGVGTKAPGATSGKPRIVYDPAAYRQAVKSRDWVHTPEGLAYKTCVYYAPNHSVVTKDEIILPSGARRQIKPCAHPTLAYPRAKLARNNKALVSANACSPTNQAWWADSCWLAPAPLVHFSEEYAVPSNPAQSGALLFLWGGLEDANGGDVLQDVLTWGANPGVVSNPNIWYVTPWYVFNGNNYVHGSSIHVAVNDTIVNSLAASKCGSGGACSWLLTTTDVNNGRQSQYPITSGVAFPALFGGVMEVPSAHGCVETPASGHAAFRDLRVTEINSTIPTPNFNTSYVNPQCSITERVATNGADIFWKP